MIKAAILSITLIKIVPMNRIKEKIIDIRTLMHYSTTLVINLNREQKNDNTITDSGIKKERIMPITKYTARNEKAVV